MMNFSFAPNALFPVAIEIDDPNLAHDVISKEIKQSSVWRLRS